jgi:hypothetical protein
MKAAWRFLQRFSWPFGLTGGAFALTYPFLPIWNVPVAIVAAFSAFAIAIVITMWGYLVDNLQEGRDSTIVVEQIRENGRLFLIRKTERLGHYMGAQLFITEGNFELFIGSGRVVNVQQNGMIQLSMENPALDAGIDQLLIENREDVRRRLIVKPAMLIETQVTEVRDEEPL